MKGSLVCGNHVLFADAYLSCYCVVLLVVVRVSAVLVVCFTNPWLLNAGGRMDLISVALLIFLQCGVVLVCVLVSMVLFFCVALVVLCLWRHSSLCLLSGSYCGIAPHG